MLRKAAIEYKATKDQIHKDTIGDENEEATRSEKKILFWNHLKNKSLVKIQIDIFELSGYSLTIFQSCVSP